MSRSLAPVDRVDRDVYPTPQALADAAVARIRRDWFRDSRAVCSVLDPGAGTGVWGQAALRAWPDAYISGIELREMDHPAGFSTWLDCADFCEFARRAHGYHLTYDLICGNPPFRLAAEFVRASVPLLAHNGVLAFLLRLDYLGSIKRGPFWEQHPPCAVYTVVPRPQFSRGKVGRSDSGEYGIFLWRSRSHAEWGKPARMGWLKWGARWSESELRGGWAI